MHHDFYQQKFLEKRWYKFTNEGLHVSKKKFWNFYEYELKYEEMGNKIIRFKGGANAWWIPASILIFISSILFLDKKKWR
ncbi:hypothetical protein BFS30_03575 [Pedobacter steynii]|uniref:Uncharacterized protein n=1 Tax=Pedobacter steynii TaxID=430522 RepID=A0A1D7QC83_9SPHI|nr:hypothetical protein BFS30_03575 [Pedobacter steynii]